MQGYLHAAAGLIAFALLSSAPAQAAVAGTEAAASASRVTLKLHPNGEQRSFDRLVAAFRELQLQYGDIGFYDTQVLDYATHGKKERLVEADRAYFLVNASKASGAGDDFEVVAFADRKAAVASQKEIGGDLRDFQDAWAAIAEHWAVELNPQPKAHAAAPKQRQQRRPPPPADCFT